LFAFLERDLFEGLETCGVPLRSIRTNQGLASGRAIRSNLLRHHSIHITQDNELRKRIYASIPHANPCPIRVFTGLNLKRILKFGGAFIACNYF
jgi:hypothetical protein